MRSYALLGSVAVLVVLGMGAAWWYGPQSVTPPALAPAATPEAKTEPSPHPVSLEALMAKDLNGHDFTVGRVLDDNAAYTRYYITYESGDLTISGIMNVPQGSPPAGGFPLLILNHGHIDTDVYTNGRGLKREQDYLARRGFVVVHPDYRNHAQSDDDPGAEQNLRLGYAEDAINAIYAVRAAHLVYINAERVGMLGHSMGGGVTQNVLVVEPGLVQAAVLYAPVSGNYRENFERYTARATSGAEQSSRLRLLTELYGTPQDNPEFWSGVSAASYYDRITAPVHIHIGTADESVEPAWSYRIRDRLQTLGKTVTLYEYDGEPHEFAAAWPLFMERTAEFFTEQLKSETVSAR